MKKLYDLREPAARPRDRLTPRATPAAFAIVKEVGLTLPGVVVATHAAHVCEHVGEVIRFDMPHPVVLVRLSRIDRDALRDILAVSWRLTAAKARRATSSPRGSNSG